MDKLTIPQALEEGYTHYNVYQEDTFGKLREYLGKESEVQDGK